MKNHFYNLVMVVFLIVGCTSKKPIIPATNNELLKENQSLTLAKKLKIATNDTVKIANDSLGYEVTVTDPGFSIWLANTALGRGFYSQSYLENRNRVYVQEFNNRVLLPARFDVNLYEMKIDYDRTINYGYEVNYLLYNYLIFFQNNYNQRLFGRVPAR